MSGFYWPAIGMVTGGFAVVAVAAALRRRAWSPASLYVGLGCLMIALLHMVAPFRGSLDPHYVGYSFGLIGLPRGPLVALVAGAVYLLATSAAYVAVRNRRGPAMMLVAAISGIALVSLGGSIVKGALGYGPAFRIELGEYLQLAPAAAIPLALLVIVLPFAVGLPWAVARCRSGTESQGRFG